MDRNVMPARAPTRTEIPFPWGPGDDKRVPDDFKDGKRKG